MLPLRSSITTIVIGLDVVGEERQRLELAVVVDLEVVPLQIGDELAVRRR